ncbi:MAG: pyrroloquinoline quinone biosynthesis peptide chaperone PqqD [Arenicella sp.]
MKIDRKQKYAPIENCLLEEMDDDILLYNPGNATTLHLNESSALIWKLLDGERSLGDIIDLLQEQYPEAAQEIEKDVFELAEQMVEKQVVTLMYSRK